MDHENSYQDTIQQLFDVENLCEKPEALKGVRVLEVCALGLGPSACDYLAAFGAEIIKFGG